MLKVIHSAKYIDLSCSKLKATLNILVEYGKVIRVESNIRDVCNKFQVSLKRRQKLKLDTI